MSIATEAVEIQNRLECDIQDAERKAIESLGRYKFAMFGYWAGVWVHLNRIEGKRRANPFKALVLAARALRTGARPDATLHALNMATAYVELFTANGAQARILNEFCKPTDGPDRDPDPERIAAHCRAVLDAAGVPRWERACGVRR